MSLAALSQKMRSIDIAMLSTKTEGGHIASRPMSNNGEVEYDGSSFYFTFEQSRTVSDIERDPMVSLAFRAFRGSGHLYVAVEGEAELIRDKAQFDAHWSPDLDRWFENGTATDGMVLIKVRARRIHYWDGEDDGEITL